MRPAPQEAPDSVCRHCGSALPQGATDGFCCNGCSLVYGLLHEEHLERYYDLRGKQGTPVAEITGRSDDKWLEPLIARVAETDLCRLDLDLQGMHCAACVWLIDTMFKREGGASIRIDPGMGKAQLVVRKGFPLQKFVNAVQRFGYRFGPSLKTEESKDGGLLLRMGICIAIAMNAMIVSISIYAGLPPGKLRHLFDLLSLGFASLSVAIGGSLFFHSAFEGIRRRVLHLDLPIALGILLAYGSSVASFLTGRVDATYFDTLDVFIALMLVGRWLQERVLAGNRRWLLASDGVDGLLTRRLDAAGVGELVRAAEIVADDRLIIAPGDLIPVDAKLDDPAVTVASLSLDWINGESAPRAFTAEETLPAGAFSATDRPLVIRATQDFSKSTLVDLLRTPVARDADEHRPTSTFWDAFARWYVALVLVAATLGFVVGYVRTHDVLKAVEIVAAVLIVTCPCAFGIAVPLAYEMVQARLRRAGLFVRAPGFLDRATRVRRVVFDKTGTLTTGVLRLEDASPLAELDDRERSVLAALAGQSTHPKSIAVARALGDTTPARDIAITEVTGRGMEGTLDGAVFRLGAPSFAARADQLVSGVDLVFSRDGQPLAALRTRESLRLDAKEEVALLRAAGLEVAVLSGDEQGRVEAVAAACGLPATSALGARTAQQKADWVRSIDQRDTLMVGDGINDALVVGEAWCSGTPAIDRPFMAARADFYFITPGLRPIREALEAARWLHGSVRSVLVTALAYNVLTVGLAYFGLMSPLACAIAMPLSSITTILRVTLPLRRQGRRATAPSAPNAPTAPVPELL